VINVKNNEKSALNRCLFSDSSSEPLEPADFAPLDSPLWDSDHRELVTKAKMSEADLNAERSKLLVPGSVPPVASPSIPVLLIQRPGNRDGSAARIGKHRLFCLDIVMQNSESPTTISLTSKSSNKEFSSTWSVLVQGVPISKVLPIRNSHIKKFPPRKNSASTPHQEIPPLSPSN